MSSLSYRSRQEIGLSEQPGALDRIPTVLYLGISASFIDANSAVIALVVHDIMYTIDFSVDRVTFDITTEIGQTRIVDYVTEVIRSYEQFSCCKFVGMGIPATLNKSIPSLGSRLWLELDIVPITIEPKEKSHGLIKRVDEQADSMARKCIMNFGPSLVPLLQVGWCGIVQVDAGFRTNLCTIENYQQTCSPATWATMTYYTKILRSNKVKIAFFSSTAQGGGVAIMRHALVRFSHLVGVDLSWYVPKPRPSVFRITKNIHNILQDANDGDRYISSEEKAALINWITDNANRYWFAEGGPLRPSNEGGADIIIIDDPQLAGLIPLIKNATPDRPVLYRSHIQIRTDLIAKAGSPQADVWDFLSRNIKDADMFISHPISSFVPLTVPRERISYMPATSDWLDGLNKKIADWDTHYYMQMYNLQCHRQQITELQWPERKYILQIARFDPSKGIATVIMSYAEFRSQLEERGTCDAPQLVICGNGSIDDPDARIVYDRTISQLESCYPHLLQDISVIRLEPNDQVLNCLISNAHVVLQLSTCEGFEVKVSEALYAGRPVIGSRTGGITLQIQDTVNGYLVEPGDWSAVAGYLMKLFTDEKLHSSMSHAARVGVSDEVGTVGNAIGWYYLVAKWLEHGVQFGLRGNEKWVNDVAREEAGQPYANHEDRLPRHLT